MTDKTAQFLPFHALNEFMRHDYRLTVIRTALNALPGLPGHFRQPIDKMTKQVVRVPGFRNGAQAPASLKVVPVAEAFGKSPELVAAILAAWAEARTDLRQQVYDLLKGRGWEVLPPEADRAKLPGFLTKWPKGEDFDLLNKAFAEAHPDSTATTDDVSLMAVWVSGRLPLEAEEETTDETDRTDTMNTTNE
ncbi:MAG: hypothetical protein HYZ49_00115 [Chloroflexi bacterium]|nr:hypothetical protein [Chloroflexota bacterium]